MNQYFMSFYDSFSVEYGPENVCLWEIIPFFFLNLSEQSILQAADTKCFMIKVVIIEIIIFQQEYYGEEKIIHKKYLLGLKFL